MSDNNIAAIKRDRVKRALMSAYEAYQRKEPRSLDKLIALVRDFAYSKVIHLEHEFADHGTAETADDWAQEISFNAWRALDRGFSGNAESFYSWLHKIAFNQATDAFHYLDDHRQTFTGLAVSVNGEDGEAEEVDNPEVYAEGPTKTTTKYDDAVERKRARLESRGGAISQKDRDGFVGSVSEILRNVAGLDRDICLIMLDGRDLTNAQIGAELGLTEDAVLSRVKRIRQRMREMKRVHTLHTSEVSA